MRETQEKKDREEELHQPQPTWAEGKEEAIFLQSQLTSIALQFFPLSIQGQFALGHKMTIIYQRGAHSSVDQYPMTELFSNREIGGSKCFKSLNMEAFD